ncbi:ABC-2 transporter permease [Propioniciclava coleopterorum]|uniref:ABC-2 transporter permease n=1 Tax=Propioniciclava coleopterorum TaxID=2714937 RepID=A0A6G7Y8E6_9ACTN|nr:ABC-2 transporter permease [Propioniciclava coleopterorum]QIK72901.1 ABC-2 transporter permease [Propioniciclava coleopterorum]
MAATWRFAGLDLRALWPYYRAMAFPVVLILVALGVTTGEPGGLIVAMAMAACIFVPQYLFSLDERSRLDTLYAVLGIPRAAVVRGRYLSTLAIAGAFMLLGVAGALVVAAVRGLPVTAGELALMAGVGVLMMAVILAGTLPLPFALGQTRARFAALGLAGGVTLVLALVALLAPGALSAALDALASWHPAAVATGLAMVAGALLAGSIALSTALYGRRDL